MGFWKRCRALEVLVTKEVRPEFCDVHMPAIVRPGDLASPLRRRLEQTFGPEREERVEEIADCGREAPAWHRPGNGEPGS